MSNFPIQDTPFKKGSLLFAPMEGVTDVPFRLSVMELFPEWDYYSTDFLRLPSNGKFAKRKFIEHIGEEVLGNTERLSKTSYQILGNANVNYEFNCKLLENIGVKHLDLNLGCPSPKVNRHKGGAFLLSDLNLLKNILLEIRQNFSFHFSTKIRIGYEDTSMFVEILKTLEECSVDSITIHGRTRAQLYKGKSNWNFIKDAVSMTNTPVIGNGDIKDVDDVLNAFNSGCHSIMLGRGALTTPWIASIYKEYLNGIFYNEVSLEELRKGYVSDFLYSLEERYLKYGKTDSFILGRLKQLARYLILENEKNEVQKQNLLRAGDLSDFMDKLELI